MVVQQTLGKAANPLLWVGSEGGMEAGLVQRAGIPYQAIPAGQVAGMGLRTLPNLLRVLRGLFASRRILNRFQPDVLLFTGGYVAVPMALAASGLFGRRTPSVVYVPDIEPGLALKLLTRFASVIALTTETSRAFFSPRKRVVVTGYPTRPELASWTREQGRAHLGLQPDRFTLLVTGGSSGARSINRALIAALPAFLPEMQVLHLAGQNDWDEVQAAARNLPQDLAAGYHPLPYLHEMGAALAAADLVVARAGASALGEFPLAGLPSILIPYPHAWRYQQTNASYLVEHGAAVLLEDAALAGHLVSTVQTLARNPQRLNEMRQSAASLAQPQAAQRLSQLVVDIAQGAFPTSAQNPGSRGEI